MGFREKLAQKVMSNMSAGEGKGVFANTFGYKEGYFKKLQGEYSDIMKKDPDNHGLNDDVLMNRMTKDYMTGADYKGDGWRRAGALAVRHGTAPAIWGAGAIGVRYATGGNMTTNSRGEQDIAGIPFI